MWDNGRRRVGIRPTTRRLSSEPAPEVEGAKGHAVLPFLWSGVLACFARLRSLFDSELRFAALRTNSAMGLKLTVARSR